MNAANTPEFRKFLREEIDDDIISKLKPSANKLTHEELREESLRERFDRIRSNGNCHKHQFDTKDDALREIQRLIDDSFGGVVGLRPYKCKHCKKFHLTSSID